MRRSVNREIQKSVKKYSLTEAADDSPVFFSKDFESKMDTMIRTRRRTEKVMSLARGFAVTAALVFVVAMSAWFIRAITDQEEAPANLGMTSEETETPPSTHPSQNTRQPLSFAGREYENEIEFLYGGGNALNVKKISWLAARAFLCMDKERLAEYLLTPNEEEMDQYTMSDPLYDFDRLELMVMIPPKITSESEIEVNYELAFEGLDTLAYLDVYLIQQEGDWKVKWIGMEG